MTDYEIYVFILCAVVFVLLTGLSVACLWIITRLSLQLINSGAQDVSILLEHINEQSKHQNKIIKRLDYAFTGVVCFVFALMFVSSLVVGHRESSGEPISTYRVVRTSSMETKNPKNTYLTKNGLDNQIHTFDLIYTKKMPDEMELKLYDIVVYEVDDMLIIHRIVGIEEPNAAHPDCRHFRLQGDAVESADRYPVLYEQMRGIYRNVRIPFIGSFILFMQSPAGWLCMILTVIAIIATPILNKILYTARKRRVAVIMYKHGCGLQ